MINFRKHLYAIAGLRVLLLAAVCGRDTSRYSFFTWTAINTILIPVAIMIYSMGSPFLYPLLIIIFIGFYFWLYLLFAFLVERKTRRRQNIRLWK